MATIKELVYRVWALLDGTVEISADSRFSYRQIKSSVKSEIAAAMRDAKFNSTRVEDYNKYGSEVFSQTYENLPILFDEKLKLKYIDLPCELIPIFDGRQVSIYPNAYFSYATAPLFLPISKQEQFINRFQSSLPEASMFYVSGKSRVYFASGGRVIEEDSVNAIVKFAIPLNDEADLGAGEDDINRVVTQSYQSLAPEIKQIDQSIDGVPNP